MLIEDSVSIDFLSDFLFTFSVYFGPDDDLGIPAEQAGDTHFSIAPKPACSTIQVRADRPLASIAVMDLTGRTVLSISEMPPMGFLDISKLTTGTYIITARSTQNNLSHATFQKVE